MGNLPSPTLRKRRGTIPLPWGVGGGGNTGNNHQCYEWGTCRRLHCGNGGRPSDCAGGSGGRNYLGGHARRSAFALGRQTIYSAGTAGQKFAGKKQIGSLPR